MIHVDVNLRGLVVAMRRLLTAARMRLSLPAPMRILILTSAKLLPSLEQRLLSLHTLIPEIADFGQIVATDNTRRKSQGLRHARRRHAGRRWDTTAEGHRRPLELHKIWVLLIGGKVQAI